MKQQIHYKESQSMYWLVALFTVITVFIILATYFQWGSKPIPSWWFALPIILLNVLIIIGLYDMQIIIDSETACVKFGIGWLQRKIPIKDFDLNTAEIIQLPWYAGVGYRIHNRGTFFNTKPGTLLSLHDALM